MRDEKTNKNAFLKRLEVDHFAGVDVIVCRTKEGKRAADALREFSESNSLPFQQWNCRDGWVTLDAAGTESKDMAVEPYAAMKSILDTDNSGATPKPEGLYVMHDINYMLPSDNPMPGIVRCIKQYVRDFANREYRLVLIVPETFCVPETLSAEVSILDFELPSRDELRETLQKVIQSSFVDDDGNPVEFEPPFDESGILRIVNAAVGMTDLEAETTMAKAIVENDDTWPETTAQAYSRVLMDVKAELVKRSEVLELHKPLDVNSVGGMDLLKAWMEKRARVFSPEAAAFGAKLPKGCGLFGVPGTGKSIMARVCADILKMPLLRVDVSRFFGSLVGQTEERVRATLKQIVAQSPCIAWIDEVDKAGLSAGGGGDSGTSQRVLGQILTFMAENEKPVFWIFTGNRVDGLPSELLRKGRLDELFNVTMPNQIEREEIIRIHLAARNQNPDEIEGLDKAVEESLGYVGAELEAAVNEAVIEAFNGDGKVHGEMIVSLLRASVPIREAFAEDFEKMRSWAQNNASPASTPCEGEDTGGREIAPAKGRRVRKRSRKGSLNE